MNDHHDVSDGLSTKNHRTRLHTKKSLFIYKTCLRCKMQSKAVAAVMNEMKRTTVKGRDVFVPWFKCNFVGSRTKKDSHIHPEGFAINCWSKIWHQKIFWVLCLSRNALGSLVVSNLSSRTVIWRIFWSKVFFVEIIRKSEASSNVDIKMQFQASLQTFIIFERIKLDTQKLINIIIHSTSSQFFTVHNYFCHSSRGFRDNFCFEFTFCDAFREFLWVWFMENSYWALPHDNHKFTAQQYLAWCPYSWIRRRNHKQQFFFYFDYFINFSHENFILCYVYGFFLRQKQSTNLHPILPRKQRDTQSERLSLHRIEIVMGRV